MIEGLEFHNGNYHRIVEIYDVNGDEQKKFFVCIDTRDIPFTHTNKLEFYYCNRVDCVFKRKL